MFVCNTLVTRNSTVTFYYVMQQKCTLADNFHETNHRASSAKKTEVQVKKTKKKNQSNVGFCLQGGSILQLAI
mgnify:CR=1 FL=1